MSRLSILLAAPLVIAVLGGVACSEDEGSPTASMQPTPTTQPTVTLAADPITRWEYSLVESYVSNKQFVEELNEMGDDGWELVSIAGAREFDFTAFFKRPVP